jgi:hypothetical protein
MQISNDKLPAEPNRFHQHGWGLTRQDGSQVRLTARLASPNPHACRVLAQGVLG